MRGYYFVTAAVLSRGGNLSDVAAAVAAGVRVVQYRQKQGRIRDLVGIGGLTLAKAPLVIAAGADAVCAIAAMVTKTDVRTEIGKFQELFRQDNHNDFEKLLWQK